MLLKASVEDQHHRDDGAYGGSGKRKSRYRKRHGQQKAPSSWPSYYQPTPTQQIITKRTISKLEMAMRKLRCLNGYGNLRQNYYIGDDLTFQIINGDSGDGDVDEKYSPQKVGHFDTQSEEFILNSESTARAW